MPPRSIVLNDEAWMHVNTKTFGSNKIFTAKYNVLSFIPKFLFEQFMRLANFYFLVISIIQVNDSRTRRAGEVQRGDTMS